MDRNQHVVPRASAMQDRELVDSCLTGEARAWTLLYQHCQENLIRAIRLLIGRSSADLDLVDEIAARVWYALVRNDGELLARFDPSRGCRLTTFLAILARGEARQYFRAERRRRAREEAACQNAPAHHSDDIPLFVDTEDGFVKTLTPAECDYYKSNLIGCAVDAEAMPYTPGNSWQLRHRVRNKLRRYLDAD